MINQMTMQSPVLSNDTFIIEDLWYIPVGNYLPVLNRPYMINAHQEAIDQIATNMHEAKLAKVTPTILSKVAASVIQPSSTGYDTGLNNQWISTPRFVFIMKVKSFDALGVEINSYIQGYTNHDGITNTGHPDPNLVHHINSIIETAPMAIPTPFGIQRREKLNNIYNVFTGQLTESIFTQRPADILENMATIEVANLMGQQNDIQHYNMGNYVTQFNNKTVSSRISNNIGTEYLSGLLTNGFLNAKDKAIHIDSYSIENASNFTSGIAEPTINDNRFIKYLNKLAGYKTVQPNFTFNQIFQLDNTIYNRFKLFNITKDYVDPLMASTPEVGDYWTGQDPVTLKAYSLIESSVALALKYGFSKLFFTASNMTSPMTGVDIFVTNWKTQLNLADEDIAYLLEIFKSKYIEEIFISETAGNTIPMHIECYVDILASSKIYLSYGGFTPNWYTIPTFANSVFSSVITIDQGTLDYSTEMASRLIGTLTSDYNVTRPYY